MCYIWKVINEITYYYVDKRNYWTYKQEQRTVYEDCEQAIRTAQLLNANVSRIKQ